MARIPEAEIERIKNEVSVERLIESGGIELKKSGKDFIGKCPFHADDTASLVVTPAKNLWHCFGCGAAGGPIDWVIKKSGVSFRHAVELLRDGVSFLAAAAVKRSTVRALDAPVSQKKRRGHILYLVFQADARMTGAYLVERVIALLKCERGSGLACCVIEPSRKSLKKRKSHPTPAMRALLFLG